MVKHTRSRPGSDTARAVALTVLSLGIAGLTWRLRPSAPGGAAPPDADIVAGCAWLAWALIGYLALAVAVTALARLIAGFGVAGESLARLAPARLRRIVDVAITTGVVATILGASTAASAGVAMRHDSTGGGRWSQPSANGALDWPGLGTPLQPATRRPATSPTPTASATSPATRPHRPTPKAGHQRAPVGLVGGGPTVPSPAGPTAHGEVVVKAGDSLWSIAARHLGPDASVQATAIAWHQWYAANRQVVGEDPDLIHPGQRLRPPAAAGSTR